MPISASVLMAQYFCLIHRTTKLQRGVPFTDGLTVQAPHSGHLGAVGAKNIITESETWAQEG